MSELETYKVYREQARAAIDAAQRIAKTAFRQCCDFIFSKYPEIESIYWNQYTPYFNDGDTCYFGRNEVYLNEVTAYGEDRDEDTPGYEDAAEKKPIPEEAYKEVNEVFEVFDDDFEFMFGDHSEITVTREGIEEEEFTNHD